MGIFSLMKESVFHAENEEDLLQSFLLTEELTPNPRLIPPVPQTDETDRFRA